MTINAIVAMAKNQAIGKNNRLLWHLPDDLLHFKQLTLNNSIIMGRKTHESIGRALPGRTNIILTHNPDFHADGCIIVHSMAEALTASPPEREIFIIGGAAIYTLFLPHTLRIYLTQVEDTFEGDAFFPVLNSAEWREHENIFHAKDARHATDFRFITLERVR